MKYIRLALLALSFVAMLGLPQVAKAGVNDFTVTNFSSDQTLTNKDPQGELNIVERINVDFTSYNHGILRAIPQSYKGHSLQLKINSVSSETGAAAQYTTYTSSGNTVLKIGSPSRTVTGPQQYTINYTVINVLSFVDGKTELYWDVNGDQWQQQFNSVEATLRIPKDLALTEPPTCYTGSYGSKDQNCTVESEASTIKIRTNQALGANQALTYVASFKESTYFHSHKWYETLGEYSALIVGAIGPTLIIGGSALWYWWRRGRDAKGTGVIVPQYDAPDNLKPIQIDGLMDFTVGNAGITATIIDLAIRGYIQIIETKENKKLRKDTISYSLKLLKSDLSSLDNNEKSIVDALFDDTKQGSVVDVSKQKNKLYSTATRLRNQVKTQLTTDGYFRAKVKDLNNKGEKALKIVIAIALLIAIGLFSGVYAIIGTVAGIIIAVITLIFIDARTAKGVAAKEHVEGLKLYLNVAEKDRIEKLQAPNAKYADKSPEPVRTVELFEKLLPYAMVLGVEKQWSKQFEDLYKSPPDWYDGNWRTFNAVYLTSHLNDGIGSAVNTAFTSPSSSGSSGSGGGGFSGGGGGGGGGGGW